MSAICFHHSCSTTTTMIRFTAPRHYTDTNNNQYINSSDKSPPEKQPLNSASTAIVDSECIFIGDDTMVLARNISRAVLCCAPQVHSSSLLAEMTPNLKHDELVSSAPRCSNCESPHLQAAIPISSNSFILAPLLSSSYILADSPELGTQCAKGKHI